MERSILDEIGTFSCENEEQITRLTGLKDGPLEKIGKVNEIDQGIIDILSGMGRRGGGTIGCGVFETSSCFRVG